MRDSGLRTLLLLLAATSACGGRPGIWLGERAGGAADAAGDGGADAAPGPPAAASRP